MRRKKRVQFSRNAHNWSTEISKAFTNERREKEKLITKNKEEKNGKKYCSRSE